MRPTRGPRPSRSRWAAVLLLLVSFAVGCADDPEPSAGEKPTSSTQAFPTRAPDPDAAKEVRAAYLAHWKAYVRATSDPGAKHPDVTAHTAGDELRRTQELLERLAAEKTRMRGRFGHRVTVQSVEKDAAVVLDCLRPQAWAEGAPRPDVPKGKDWGVGTRATLESMDGAWKVTLISDHAPACSAQPVLPPADADQEG